MRIAALAATTAAILAGCGAATATSTTSTAATSSPKPQPIAATNLPDPCSLVTASEASAALQVPLRQTQDESTAGYRSCDWVNTTSSLSAGRGSAMNLYFYPGPTISEATYYHALEAQGRFVPTEIDGYRAIVAGAEYEVDLGSVLVTGVAISTVSLQASSGAERTIIATAIRRLCRLVRCEA